MQSFKKLAQISPNHLPALILLSGEEPFLMKRFQRQLIEKILPEPMRELNLAVFESSFQITDVLESLETLPVMAAKKLVVLKNPFFLETKGRALTAREDQRLHQYLQKPSPDSCLIFYCGTKPDGRKKTFKLVKENGWVEMFPRLKEAELRSFIMDEAKRKGKEFDPAAIRRFIDSFDYFGREPSQDLQDVSNEIAKLSALAGTDDIITRSHVELSTQASFQNDVFLLIESFAMKRASETQVRFHQLLARGEPLLKVVGFLRNQFRSMIRMKVLQQKGYSQAKIADKLKQHPFSVKKNLEYCKQFSVEDLLNLLNAFLQIDRQMKSGYMEPLLAMELLITEVCNE